MPNPPNLSRHEIAEIVHELRSPLGGFEAMLELLARTPLSPEQHQLVDALEASAQHLRGVLGRVLPAHEGESAGATRLGPLLGAIAASAAARASARGLGFQFEIDPAVNRDAEIDSMPLRQVLENLIDNAIRATPAGLVFLTVEPGEAGRLAFSLADDGPGLDPEEAQSRMAPGGGGVSSAVGNGLGLPIAARLVSRNGGTIGVQRRPEGGTTFRFDWPDRLRPRDDAAARLLVIDDHPASRLVLRTILGALGFDVVEAATVEAARAHLARESFAAILTDLHMPDGGGEAILQDVAALPASQRPATIVVSADDPRDDPALCTLVDQVVLKPLALPALVEALRGVGLKPRPARAA